MNEIRIKLDDLKTFIRDAQLWKVERTKHKVFQKHYRIKRNTITLILRGYWKNIIGIVERGRYGITIDDTWSFDNYLTSIIIPGLTRLRDSSVGYPSEITAEEWEEILQTMIDGFEAQKRLCDASAHNWRDKDEVAALEAQWKKGSKLFIKWYNALWD